MKVVPSLADQRGAQPARPRSARELTLRTNRLELLATTLAHIDAEMEDPPSLGGLLHVAIPSSWPPGEYDRNALEFFRDQLRAGGLSHVGWYGWYAMVCNASGERETLVAAAGYVGPPKDGSVEIGFSVVPEARGRGYATEIVRALVERAFEQPEIQTVIAHTYDSNEPSTRVLLRCRFLRMGAGGEPGVVKYQIERNARKGSP